MNATKQTILSLTFASLLAAGAALAEPGPRHGRGHGDGDGPHGVPSAETLATIDGLSASQQVDIRKILRERGDAEDALHARMRGERETLEQRERGEHERIEEQASQKLRGALGEDGYRIYASWLEGHGPHGAPPFGPGKSGPDGKTGSPRDLPQPPAPR